MAFRFKLRRNTVAGWASLNPVLLDGEPGLESATGVAPDKIKYGDGVTPWNDLPYSGDELGNVAAEADTRAAADAALADALADEVAAREAADAALAADITAEATARAAADATLTSNVTANAAAITTKADAAATTAALAGKQATIPSGTYAEYLSLAANPDLLLFGAITRDSNGAATSAPVVWPNGQPGTYTATTVSAAFPGAVDAYTITYGSPVTRTYTQPAVTRDASTGAVTNRPAITVA